MKAKVTNGPFEGLEAIGLGSNADKQLKAIGIALLRATVDAGRTLSLDEDVKAFLQRPRLLPSRQDHPSADHSMQMQETVRSPDNHQSDKEQAPQHN